MKDWMGKIAVEGEVSEDGRVLERGSLTWDLPVPLIVPPAESYEGTRVIGRVNQVWRQDGNVWASGMIEDDLLAGSTFGCGIDTDNMDAEYDGGGTLIVQATRLRALAAYVGGTSGALWGCFIEVET